MFTICIIVLIIIICIINKNFYLSNLVNYTIVDYKTEIETISIRELLNYMQINSLEHFIKHSRLL